LIRAFSVKPVSLAVDFEGNRLESILNYDISQRHLHSLAPEILNASARL
jgi:hypothetical protein